MTLIRYPTAGVRSARVALIAATVVSVLPTAAVAQKIVVGKNVHVSGGHGREAHSEVILAADPKNAGRLLAGSHIAYGDSAGTKSIAYVSFDTGKTWTISLERRDSSITGDPAVGYGPDGSAFFATLARWGWYRSRDGGRTWDPPTKISPAYSWDREYIAADFTGGKYNGRVYMNSTVFPATTGTDTSARGGSTAVALYTSLDGARHSACRS